MVTFWYRVFFWMCRIGLFFWHPVFHVIGREFVPTGKVVLAANHSGCADAVWLLLALNLPKMSRIIAKKELRSMPVLGWIMEKLGIIFVDRAAHDGTAYHTCVQALEAGEQMVVFVEGTRCNGNKHVRAKTGAVRMAVEADAPIVPVFITRNKTPFCPINVIFGQPYHLEKRESWSHDDYQHASDELLRTIYKLGGDTYADHIGENGGVLLRS